VRGFDAPRAPARNAPHRKAREKRAKNFAERADCRKSFCARGVELAQRDLWPTSAFTGCHAGFVRARRRTGALTLRGSKCALRKPRQRNIDPVSSRRTMKNRTRLIVLAALLLCLVPVTYFVNRDTTVSPEEARRQADKADRAFFDVKIPSVKLPGTKSVQPPYKHAYQFRTDWFTWNLPIWEQALADYKGKPNLNYLEVGVFEGRSALWMLDNVLTDPSCHATLCDLFQDAEIKNYKDVFLANLKLSGHEGRATVVEGFSQIELRKLPVDSFDIIYIDGSHMAADVLEDAVLCHRLLKRGGLVIYDDYLGGLENPPAERVKPALDAFYPFFKDEYDVVHSGYQVMLRKKPAPSATQPATDRAGAP
jgi:predicted O-methyltransferase YrrM